LIISGIIGIIWYYLVLLVFILFSHLLIFSFSHFLINLPVWLTLPVRLAPLPKLIISGIIGIFGIIGVSCIIAFLIKKGTFIKRPLNILYFFYLLSFTFYLNLSLSNKSPKPFFSFWSMFEHTTILQNLTESITYTPINKVI